MKVVEIGNLGGVEGVDCGILISSTPEELSAIPTNLIYKDVSVVSSNILNEGSEEELIRLHKANENLTAVKTYLSNANIDRAIICYDPRNHFDPESAMRETILNLKNIIETAQKIANGENMQ